MIEQLLQAILEQLQEPRADLEKNLRALLSEMITRMDLVSQEEFLRQQTALLNAQKNIANLLVEIETLTEKVALLESPAAP
ncbi:accessory factor UbiK family protein [Alkanindiges illinoisensis]|uniref:Accessory factor UbiK family protein n=1 Tax=Alkanindiges illinoisensis TaxID=197183 RepID=A0A4Y7XC15_9GAMM|nr:accessory factor UbiK family protein [Alkanindiges illinoisensis]TEU26878.1 accessory factor UbiK family protein [Alkanindiges illinoisensis]